MSNIASFNTSADNNNSTRNTVTRFSTAISSSSVFLNGIIDSIRSTNQLKSQESILTRTESRASGKSSYILYSRTIHSSSLSSITSEYSINTLVPATSSNASMVLKASDGETTAVSSSRLGSVLTVINLNPITSSGDSLALFNHKSYYEFKEYKTYIRTSAICFNEPQGEQFYKS